MAKIDISGVCAETGTEESRRSLDDHAKAIAGIECRKDADVIDETPMAYESIDAVMEAQSVGFSHQKTI